MSTRLYNQWIEAKAEEKEAQERRKQIEDKLFFELKIDPAYEGQLTFDNDDRYKVKVVTRFNRKVDADAVQQIAIETGLGSMVNTLFRWKPEISIASWKATDKSITDLFAPAVTTTPGRPGFSIEKVK